MSDETDPKWGTQEWHRLHPIYYKPEDLKATPDQLVAKLRRELADIRGKLFDIQFSYGWQDRLKTGEEGLTLVISYLWDVMKEMEKVYSKEQKP